MADYYPLISRAVSNMGSSTPEQRRALYERATNALVGQLRNADPPVSEEEIERERKALEEAIRRVETDANGGVDREVFAGMLENAVAEAVAEQRPPPLEARAEPAAGNDQPEQEQPRAEASQPAPERLRPQAPRPQVRERSWVRGTVILGALAIVVALIGVPAYMLRHQPADFAPRPDAAGQPAEPDRKIQDRLAGDGGAAAPADGQTAAAQPAPAAPSEPAPAAPAPDQQPAAPAQQPAAANQPVPVLQRAILVEEPNEGSKDLKQTVGRVLWRLDSVPGGVGEPLDAAVRADVDLSDAGLKAEILIRRNRDAALPASHTIETKFLATDKATNGKVRDVGVPEMRQEEATRGTPLAGIAVPVTENLFLTGLSNLPADVQRNLESLRTRNWFMLPLRFANGRRAVLLFEKGGPGDRTVTDALQAWQQG
jgi:hypothetical protein